MNRRESADLDRHITGNYGEDQITDAAACWICGEAHDPASNLSFDGKGINDCSIYRNRLATLTLDCPPEMGRLFAAAPDLLAALRCIEAALSQPATYPGDVGFALRTARDAINRATTL